MECFNLATNTRASSNVKRIEVWLTMKYETTTKTEANSISSSNNKNWNWLTVVSHMKYRDVWIKRFNCTENRFIPIEGHRATMLTFQEHFLSFSFQLLLSFFCHVANLHHHYHRHNNFRSKITQNVMCVFFRYVKCYDTFSEWEFVI